MSSSKTRNNKLALELATDRRYKIQKNGTVKKLGYDGKYREVGTTRHGYNVVSYKGKKIVVARVIVAKKYYDLGVSTPNILGLLSKEVVVRKNGVSLDDRTKNLYDTLPSLVSREETKRLTRKQIARMVELFYEGYSVAKIARRFRRKTSRSHVSTVIKRELAFGV